MWITGGEWLGSPAALSWDTLDAAVRAVLAGEAGRWTALPPERQRVLADGAGRWLALDGIGRAQANARWHTWRSLTPEQRERVQKAWAGFRELTPARSRRRSAPPTCASRNCRRTSATACSIAFRGCRPRSEGAQ